ncbi:DUF6371 domain-containing protein [Sphingobacterium daejeonense]|uniref:DUF6371 domain-containing protein n=1 Tax=Sphingobacterium daejeonense TaxID=371142 RepID=UPI0010C5332E|nr:DUF6371 domain-containing protein [Sphingobacterium daejeonense]VTQ00293.1 Uncharacterised protein [Sphingobacterium daejeonense]
MSNYRYQLEPYRGMRSRYECPSCGKKGKFAKYIDIKTREYVDTLVGRCERSGSCGHHYTPSQYFEDNNIKPAKREFHRPVRIAKKETNHIENDILKNSLNAYDQNNFVEYLLSRYGTEITMKAVVDYRIGTSKHWQGSTVFWQVDKDSKIRSGKIMLYNPETCKRIREPFSHIQWVHSALKIKDFNLSQCLFGEHLLNGNNKPVAIVESEKSAIIASLYFPKYIWLACCSLQGLNKTKCEVLRGREVILFPDLKGLHTWQEKASELKELTKITVSTFLEENATQEEIDQGLDIADYLLKYDLSEFSETIKKENSESQLIEFLSELSTFIPEKEQVSDGIETIEDFKQYIIDATANPNGKRI